MANLVSKTKSFATNLIVGRLGLILLPFQRHCWRFLVIFIDRALIEWLVKFHRWPNRPLHFLQKLQTPAERGSAIHMEYTTHMTHFFLISLCPPIIPPTLRIVYILHCE